jgi:biopolymer transport protein ExbB/TolQ
MPAMVKFFASGGPFMYLILGISAFGMAVVLERTYYLYVRCRINSKNLLAALTRLVRAGKVGEARRYCLTSKAPLAAILESMLWHYEQGLSNDEIKSAVAETELRELPRVRKRTHYLALLFNVSVLLGILGTISGLIQDFSPHPAADLSQRFLLLFKGISGSLNCTAFGLFVGILCMVAHSVLQTRSGHIIEEIDESSARLLTFLFLQRTNG